MAEIQILIFAFVLILIGTCLISPIATQTQAVTTLSLSQTDSVDISSARTLNTNNVTNEVGWLNNSGYRLAYYYQPGFKASITTVTNRSDGTLLLAANYSVTGARIYNASAVLYDNVSINYTYTFLSVNTAAIPTTSFMTQRPSASFLTDFSECAISETDIKFYNQSGVEQTSGYTFNTDGNGAVGSLSYSNVFPFNSTSSNSTSITYSYCPTTYISGWGGTILNLVPGFFALALLGIGIGLFYGVAREKGIF